jgi:hypothetical protein
MDIIFISPDKGTPQEWGVMRQVQSTRPCEAFSCRASSPAGSIEARPGGGMPPCDAPRI